VDRRDNDHLMAEECWCIEDFRLMYQRCVWCSIYFKDYLKRTTVLKLKLR